MEDRHRETERISAERAREMLEAVDGVEWVPDDFTADGAHGGWVEPARVVLASSVRSLRTVIAQAEEIEATERARAEAVKWRAREHAANAALRATLRYAREALIDAGAVHAAAHVDDALARLDAMTEVSDAGT